MAKTTSKGRPSNETPARTGKSKPVATADKPHKDRIDQMFDQMNQSPEAVAMTISGIGRQQPPAEGAAANGSDNNHKSKSYEKDPDGRLSSTFQRWQLSRETVMDLLESAAEKNPKCETMFLDIKCQKDWRSQEGVGGSYSWEFFCHKADMGPTEFLGHILREWENLKVREAKVEILNGVVGVATQTIHYANTEAKNSADRQTVLKVAGLLKDGNDVNVQVNTNVQTLAAMNVPSADEGILKRFEILKDV